jgi:hypothetical protein
MMGPETLVRALGCKAILFIDPICYLLRKAGSPSLPSNYKSLIHYININTLPDLMILIYNLPSYLDAHPNVSPSPSHAALFVE